MVWAAFHITAAFYPFMAGAELHTECKGQQLPPTAFLDAVSAALCARFAQQPAEAGATLDAAVPSVSAVKEAMAAAAATAEGAVF